MKIHVLNKLVVKQFFILQINSLEFDQNNEITAIVSSEKEILTLNKKINPTAANVMYSVSLILEKIDFDITSCRCPISNHKLMNVIQK